jgi:hypothetical protein
LISKGEIEESKWWIAFLERKIICSLQ